MPRIHAFEILDQAWCPAALRLGATDALEALISASDVYRPVRPLIFSAIQGWGGEQIVDLCSGGGGPWLSAPWQALFSQHPELSLVLTDKFPSDALAMRARSLTSLRSIASPVDATDVPGDLRGFRTIFSSLHHFPDPLASKILEDAVRSGCGLASAEATSRSARAAIGILVLPFLVLWLTPHIRPFRWSRLLLTYLIPAIPFVILWDGLISCLRTRTPQELLALTRPFSEFHWTAGHARSDGSWLRPVYLIGLPKIRGPLPEQSEPGQSCV